MKTVNATASLFLSLLLSLSAAFGIAAAVEAPPTLMSRADYVDALKAIQYDFRAALAHCRESASPTERAVCRAEAQADQRIAVARLDARYRGTMVALEREQRARERAEYAVSVARRLAPT